MHLLFKFENGLHNPTEMGDRLHYLMKVS